MAEIPDYIRQQARRELARRFFYDYCSLKYPAHYTDDRAYLKDICERIQAFTEQNDKKFLVVTMPPRHRKSFTATNLTEWLFGTDNHRKVMTGSYNETLSTTFASKVRNTILEGGESSEGRTLYRDIFPNTKVQYGEASKSYWALEGSGEKNYLATSPTGTATGIGANIIIIDDVIKNQLEAYNDTVKQGHFDWLTNTMMQRTEGEDWKVIIIMTRWATDDLAGRVIEEYGDLVEHISYSAVQPDGSMLDPSVLNELDYTIKTSKMNPDIVDANYNQKPVDIKGRLYSDFATYDDLPQFDMVYAITDTADQGTDYLCTIIYGVKNNIVYVIAVYFSDEAMEVTEMEVAKLLDLYSVNIADFESNNGGRGFSRNVERILRDKGNTKCVITSHTQTQNKEARILSSSAWVQQNVMMPPNWQHLYKGFYDNVMKYQRKGKNAHDDGVDVLASIYEKVANTSAMEWGDVI